ncbi:MAG: hypothetical protein EXS40_03825 [Opitutaceae bacterium]|nr:hypothetical protein [Opitutaceae bacterium]
MHPESPTLLAYCLAPGRLEFATVAPSFPAECWHVLNRVDPFAYLLAIAMHATEVKARPLAWLSWSYPLSKNPAALDHDPPDPLGLPA